MIAGTTIGDPMLARAGRAGWGNPMWDSTDVAAGSVMEGEAQLLYGLVRAMTPDIILEVGTSHGYSTLHLAAGCRANSRGVVHTVEIDGGRRASAKGNVAEAGLVRWVIFHDEIPRLDYVNLAFLDAGHESEDVRQYLNGFTLAPDGLVVIHDALYWRHVDEAITGTDWRVMYLPQTSLMGLAFLTKGGL